MNGESVEFGVDEWQKFRRFRDLKLAVKKKLNQDMSTFDFYGYLEFRICVPKSPSSEPTHSSESLSDVKPVCITSKSPSSTYTTQKIFTSDRNDILNYYRNCDKKYFEILLGDFALCYRHRVEELRSRQSVFTGSNKVILNDSDHFNKIEKLLESRCQMNFDKRLSRLILNEFHRDRQIQDDDESTKSDNNFKKFRDSYLNVPTLNSSADSEYCECVEMNYVEYSDSDFEIDDNNFENYFKLASNFITEQLISKTICQNQELLETLYPRTSSKQKTINVSLKSEVIDKTTDISITSSKPVVQETKSRFSCCKNVAIETQE